MPSAGPNSGIYNLLPNKALNKVNNKQVVLVGGVMGLWKFFQLVIITIESSYNDEDYLLPFLCVTTSWR